MRHTVHIYVTMRVKVENIEADNHEEAMTKADKVLNRPDVQAQFLNGRGNERGLILCADESNLTHPDGPPVRVSGPFDAEEITGYLVDEEGDEDFERSRSYDSDHGEHPITGP